MWSEVIKWLLGKVDVALRSPGPRHDLARALVGLYSDLDKCKKAYLSFMMDKDDPEKKMRWFESITTLFDDIEDLEGFLAIHELRNVLITVAQSEVIAFTQYVGRREDHYKSQLEHYPEWSSSSEPPEKDLDDALLPLGKYIRDNFSMEEIFSAT